MLPSATLASGVATKRHRLLVCFLAAKRPRSGYVQLQQADGRQAESGTQPVTAGHISMSYCNVKWFTVRTYKALA